MKVDQFISPQGAFTRTVRIRFSHCDPAGIVYFPHYFDMFNGLIEDWSKDLADDSTLSTEVETYCVDYEDLRNIDPQEYNASEW